MSVLTDTRGPYTASIYADGSTCLEGNGITISSGTGGGGKSSVPAAVIELNGAGESDSDGHALTIVDGAVGAGVTGVTITRSDGSSVQATVKNGWYLAWWPGTEHAVAARVASPSGTRTESFPTGPGRPSRPARRAPTAGAATALCPQGRTALNGRRYGSPAPAAAACRDASALGVGRARPPRIRCGWLGHQSSRLSVASTNADVARRRPMPGHARPGDCSGVSSSCGRRQGSRRFLWPRGAGFHWKSATLIPSACPTGHCTNSIR